MKRVSQIGKLGKSNDEEHRRIAREIHDDFGQRAAALAMFLGALKKDLPATEKLTPQLDSLIRSATDLGEDLRRFSHDLHPLTLVRRGLLASLREHCTKVEAQHGLEIDLQLNEAIGPLQDEIALALFRVAQEGLANIACHAQAQKVLLRLLPSCGGLALQLKDDGRGFDLASSLRAGGLGLSSLAERAQMFGGTCRVKSAPGYGTEINFWIPIPEKTAWGKMCRLLRQHRLELVAAGLIFFVLLGGILTTRREAERARQSTLRADATVRFLEGLFQAADPRLSPGVVPNARELLARGAAKLERDLDSLPLQKAQLLDTLGSIESELGFYDEAGKHLTEALALRRREPTGDPLALANTLAHAGKLARLSGRGDSVPYYREAVALREKYSASDDQDLIRATAQLGTTLAAGGQFDEAESYLRRALAAGERAWGEGDPEVAKILHNLAGLAHQREDQPEAQDLLERALAIRENKLADDDPDLLESLEALALLRLAQGRPEEASSLLEKLLPKTEKTFGSDHPSYARVLYNLALARSRIGREKEALELLEQAKAVAEKRLAPDHWLAVQIEDLLSQLQ